MLMPLVTSYEFVRCGCFSGPLKRELFLLLNTCINCYLIFLPILVRYPFSTTCHLLSIQSSLFHLTNKLQICKVRTQQSTTPTKATNSPLLGSCARSKKSFFTCVRLRFVLTSRYYTDSLWALRDSWKQNTVQQKRRTSYYLHPLNPKGLPPLLLARKVKAKLYKKIAFKGRV